MPVNLDDIPDIEPNVPRPVTFRWVITFFAILLVGLGLTLWLWEGERSGLKFWFTAVALPVLMWGLVFAVRRTGYKLERVGTYARNKEREALMASETARGQRFAWVIGEFLVNVIEPDETDTRQAIVNKTAMLEHVITRDGVSSIRHSALPEQGSPEEIFCSYMEDISGQAREILARLPVSMPCYLAFDGSANVEALADALISKIHFPLRRIRDLSGFTILDYWLDRHHDIPAALLVISVQIYDVPPQDSGEAIAAMLLSNRRLSDMASPSVRLHRPQISTQGNLLLALNRAMLWAKLDSTAPLRGWISGGKLASDEIWSNACTAMAPKLTVQRNVSIDTAIGYAGVVAPWQAAILAYRQCLADHEPQIVAIESAPSCHQLCAVTSNIRDCVNQS